VYTTVRTTGWRRHTLSVLVGSLSVAGMERVPRRLNGHWSSWALSTRTFFSYLCWVKGAIFFAQGGPKGRGGYFSGKIGRSEERGKWLRMSYDSM
jgi:hypothetical protein